LVLTAAISVKQGFMMDINYGLLSTYVISLLLMIGLPIALGYFAIRYLKVSWWVVFTGVLTFIGSQVLRIPASYGLSSLFQSGILPVPSASWIPVFNGLVAGLLAGVFEETARLVGFMFLKKKAHPFKSAIGLGIGHGGIESVLLGILGTGTTLASVLFYNAGAQLAKGTSTQEIQYVLAQIQQFWTTSWHFGLLPGLERVIALSIQIVLSIMVWKAIADRQWLWFVLAILYHTFVNAISVYLTQIGWGYWAVEGVLAIFLVINVYVIYSSWKVETAVEADEEFEDEDDEDDVDDEDDDEDDDVDDEENEVDDVEPEEVEGEESDPPDTDTEKEE
jgi:uncharacterized membrane protein YhfC